MIIKINGKAEMIDKQGDLAKLIAARGLSPDRVVIEYNFNIIPKERWGEIMLSDNDNIEIVSFVGGG